MKVILTKDVARVGRRYEVIETSSGYAKNFLFPQKLAEPATPAKIALLDKKREQAEAEEKVREEELKAKFTTLGDTVLTITTKSDEQGNLYKKVGVADILTALQTSQSIELPETAIFLEKPIDKTGEHQVVIEHKSNKVEVTVKVEREQ